MKNTKTITKKESRHIQLKEITLSKQQLINLVKNELLKFYIEKLTDIDSYSVVEKEKLINILQNLAYEKYNKMINNKIPNKFPFDYGYNVKVVIKDDLKGCGNLELTINLIPSWIKSFSLKELNRK
ncbi:hypothetical protein [Neobacillus sp.]|uniref:hypothetical protein n=1 Tax=Neobacillus sp. TaxID=2675273 RepID=UPI0028A06A15|nr:hypothetical protein [Neobacillus sp.]